MIRKIIYGVLGLLISSIVGVLVASVIYKGEYSTRTNIIIGIITLVGTVASVWFANWMDSRGEQKLENFSNKPKMIYGVYGVFFGALISFWVARSIDPANIFPGYDLLGILVSGVFGGWLSLYMARQRDLSTEGTSVKFTTKNQVIFLIVGFVLFLILRYFLHF